MKKLLAQILLGLFAVTFARADTPLTIGYYGTVPCCGGPCWDDELPGTAVSTNGSFTLAGVSGTGTVSSAAIQAADNVHLQSHMLYSYSVNMGALSVAANHCVKLLIHFGSPLGCSSDVLVFTNSGGVTVSSASKAPYGDITFTFGSGCLAPGKTSDNFQMLTDANPRTGSVTIIDDYVDPNGGATNESRIQVTAIVPDIPPNWVYFVPIVPNSFFQGDLGYVGTNQYQQTNFLPTLVSNGPYDFTFQLVDAVSNGLPLSGVATQTVQVINGLFNSPLPFDPSAFSGGACWLNIGVKPSNLPAVQFNPLTPALPIVPAPQALYAFSAGVVADIAPGQAVLSLNGVTGNAVLQGGQGIQVALNSDGQTITISQAVGSDRAIKADFAPVDADGILAKVAALPIQSWRYTNELAGIRHIGPMAQDFKAAFGLGSDDKTIAIVDEGGVALTAIQALNQALEQKDAEIKDLEQRLQKLEQNAAQPGSPQKGPP